MMRTSLGLPALRRGLLLSGLCLLALLALTGVASAATLADGSAGQLVYTADAGEINSVTVTYSGTNTFTLADDGVAAITVTAANCTTPDFPNAVTCTPAYSSLLANLGDEDDFFEGSGSSLVMTVNAGVGSDGVIGGSAADTLNGDDGGDTIDGGDGADTVNGGAGPDTLNDTETTTIAADTMNGGADEDFFNVGTDSNGADVMDGGAGTDEVSYQDRGGPVTANLTGGNVSGESSEHDTLNNVENVDGSLFAANDLTGSDSPNVMYGGPQPDTISGAGGDDSIYGGLGGDTVNGGTGSDWVDYTDRTAPVAVDMSGGGDGSVATTHNGELGELDSIKNIENVNTGTGGDTVTGNSQRNIVYDGGGPGDNINTLGGDDEIDARDGLLDSADCGAGNDVAYVDVIGEFSSNVNDVVANCEGINGDYIGAPAPATPTTPPPATTAGAFLAKLQPSPKADTVAGTVNIAADGSDFEVDLLYSGKLAKVTVVGKLVKKSATAGVHPFTVKLNKKASKLALKKGKKGLALTVKVTIKPPTGSSTIKQSKVNVKKGKATACLRTARANAHMAC
jgi:hypothetical protein